MVRALAASLRGDALEGIALGKEALALLPEQAGVARSGSVSAMAEGYRRTGDVMAAWRVLNEAQPIDERIGNLLGMAGNAILRARLLVMQGKLRQAAESYHTVIGSMSERHEFVLEALIGLADLLREWNELAEALTHLEHVIALALEIRNELLLARAALSRARIIQVCGDAEQAEAAFASAVVQAQQSGNQSLMAEARIYQARWWLVQGNREEASRWRTANAADYQQELAVLTLVRALLAHDEADEALGLLDECCKHARAQGRIGSEIEIMTLMALAYHTLGKSDFALQALQRALLLAEPGGYVRLFVDEGVPMAMLLRTLLSEWKGKPGIDYLHKLLAILKTDLSRSLTAKALEPPPLFEPLSQRERKVLRLLAAGMSNPEIANELVVSLNTVKTQVQSLYRKLNVSGRKEAIAVAKRLQLV
jgi:LuxR family maltose regulon positive regulatory protein